MEKQIASEDKKLRFMFGKGWSLMNVLTGLVLVGLGYLLLIVDSFFVGGHAFLGDVAPIKLGVGTYIVWLFTLALIVVGSLGFWLVIPAFQKWGKTKPWLAWIFLIIALAVVGLLVIFRNTPI